MNPKNKTKTDVGGYDGCYFNLGLVFGHCLVFTWVKTSQPINGCLSLPADYFVVILFVMSLWYSQRSKNPGNSKTIKCCTRQCENVFDDTFNST